MKSKAILCILFASIMLPLALPNELLPGGNAVLGFMCFIPFFLALCLSPGYGFSAVLGIIFGALTTLIAHYWLFFYGEYSLWTVTGVVLAYMIFNAVLFPVLHALIKSNKNYRIFLFAITWTAYEYLKSSGFLGFPWSLLSHTVHDLKLLIQIADLSGIWGLSFFVALINAFGGDVLYRSFFEQRTVKLRYAKPAFMLLTAYTVLFLLYGGYVYLKPLNKQAEINLVLVQQNDDPWESVNGTTVIQKAIDLSREQTDVFKPDLVLWSETSYPYYIREEQFSEVMAFKPDNFSLKEYITSTGAHFILGIVLRPRDRDGFENATVFVSPQGEMIDKYAKQHLVPIAESIPLYDLDIFKSFFGDVLGLSSGWLKGTAYTIYKLPLKSGATVNLATPICFEDSFPYLCRNFINNGADILVNLSNVAWSKQKSAEIQMYVAAIYRSIENRCMLIRSTNAGVSGIINPRGELTASMNLFTADSLAVTLPFYGPPPMTLYRLWGDYLPVLFLCLILFYCVCFFLKQRGLFSGRWYKKWKLKYQGPRKR